MHINETEKENQLKTLLYTLKILAVFFSVIPIFQYIFKGQSLSYMLENSRFTASVIALGMLLVILLLVVLISYNSKHHLKLFAYAEIIVFNIVFLVAIFLSGKNESYYKFIFIFLIVCCSIEYSLRFGMWTAVISSALIFIIDYIYTSSGSINIYLENDIALASMFVSIAFIIGLYSKIQKQHIELLKLYADVDGLTNVYNHRYFYQQLEKDCKEAAEHNTPVSLIMIDIDFFKIYNDMYGHQQGDSVLCELVGIIKDVLSPGQILCRYGGEEFTIILPQGNLETAVATAEKIRFSVQEHPFYGENVLPSERLTVSIGVAEFNSKLDHNDLVKRADSALYRAKLLHRNRVESYSSIIEQYYLEDCEAEGFDLVSLKTLGTIIRSKDNYTYNHMERVANFCDIFSTYLNLSPQDQKTLVFAAFLHDLGKIYIEKEILLTTEKLTEAQWNVLKQHPLDGAKLVREMGCSDEIASIVEQHHERMDGAGYPNGLKGDEICRPARMLIIADSFDAMTNNRPYNRRKSFAEAFNELERCSGSQFDPKLVVQFIAAISKSHFQDESCD